MHLSAKASPELPDTNHAADGSSSFKFQVLSPGQINQAFPTTFESDLTSTLFPMADPGAMNPVLSMADPGTMNYELSMADPGDMNSVFPMADPGDMNTMFSTADASGMAVNWQSAFGGGDMTNLQSRNAAPPDHCRIPERGLKWTPAMDRYLVNRKLDGDTYTAIAQGMQAEFNVTLSPNMLTKRFVVVSNETAKRECTIVQAITAGRTRIIGVLEEEVKKLNVDAGMDSEVTKEVMRRLPELIKTSAVKAWVQVQAEGRQKAREA